MSLLRFATLWVPAYHLQRDGDDGELSTYGQEGWPAGARYGYTYFAAGDMPRAAVFSDRDRAGRAATVYVTGVPDNRQHLIDAFVAVMCHR